MRRRLMPLRVPYLLASDAADMINGADLLVGAASRSADNTDQTTTFVRASARSARCPVTYGDGMARER